MRHTHSKQPGPTAGHGLGYTGGLSWDWRFSWEKGDLEEKLEMGTRWQVFSSGKIV